MMEQARRPGICMGVALLTVLLAAAAPAGERDQAAARLESVRARISELEQSIEAARGEADVLQRQLREVERDIAAGETRLRELQARMRQQADRLDQLRAERERTEAALAGARRALAALLRAAYKHGRQDYLKLLLNQQDAAAVGRVLVYYEYFNTARRQRIRAINAELGRLAELARRVEGEQEALATLEQEERARLEELQGLRDARARILAHLDERIADEGEELAALREDQARLQALLERLRQPSAPAPARKHRPDTGGDFAALRGQLAWPVEGRVLNRFGSTRHNGAMTWQGVQLAVAQGDPVHAISDGEVIFADQFRNLGLLIIVDHGDGYMSLYGHNQELLKGEGESVAAGEIIARAGGGRNPPTVYFEIRHDGKPVDPAQWCARS